MIGRIKTKLKRYWQAFKQVVNPAKEALPQPVKTFTKPYWEGSKQNIRSFKNTALKPVKLFLRPYWRSLKEILRPVKRLLVQPLIKLPFSSEIIGPPKGLYDLTLSWINTYTSTSNQKQPIYQEVFPGHLIKRLAPGTIEPEVHWKFRIEYERESPADFVAAIPEGRVWGESGIVISPDDKVLVDVSIEYVDDFPRNLSVFHQWKLQPVQWLDERVAVLTVDGGSVYQHWLHDALPRIELIRRSGISLDSIDKFLVNTYQTSFHQETLAALGIPPEKVIESKEYPHIKARELIVPSRPGLPGNLPYWACEFLSKDFRNTLLKTSTSNSSDTVDRIYISRGQAIDRKILNEPEVIDLLGKFGFKAVLMETLSMAEKASLLTSAKAIVAPHGSGLGNLIFCNPGVKVVEIFSPVCVNVCNWAASNQLGLDYYYLISEGKRPPDYTEPKQSIVGRANMEVNLKSLSDTLELAGVC